MATEELELNEDLEEAPEDLDEEPEDVFEEDLEDVFDDDEESDEGSEAAPVTTGSHDEETAEALEELESEELELLEEEANDVLLVDEVKELKAIRREELTMNVDTQAQRSDEFVCQSCFMVKRTSQLANRKKMLCTDCAS
jgi:hypothetical protein